MGEKQKNISYGTIALCTLGAALLFIILGLVASNYSTTQNVKNLLECPGKPSDDCFTGNACLERHKEKRCLADDDDDHHHHTHSQGGSWWHHKKNCNLYVCSAPRELADGSCCNEEDFCYLPDPKKVCQSGECVSKNYSNCKGSCNINSDCLVYPVPISPNFYGDITTTCYWGTCMTILNAAFMYVNPMDALDANSTYNRSTVACLQGECYLVGDPLVDEFPYQCIYTWKCSAHNQQVVIPVKKRDISSLRQEGIRQRIAQRMGATTATVVGQAREVS